MPFIQSLKISIVVVFLSFFLFFSFTLSKHVCIYIVKSIDNLVRSKTSEDILQLLQVAKFHVVVSISVLFSTKK